VLPPRAHGRHCGPLVGPGVIPLYGIERTLAVRAADGVQVAVENGHRYAQPPGVHARHFGPFVLLWNRVIINYHRNPTVQQIFYVMLCLVKDK